MAENHEEPSTRRSRGARERLLEAANDLFYAQGVRTVGINKVIEVAGVVRGSLYKTFGSKDALIEAYLEGQHESTLANLHAQLDSVADPKARILAVFDVQAKTFAMPGFNGCAFMDASAEAPRGGVIERAAERFRTDVRGQLHRLVGEARLPTFAPRARSRSGCAEGSGVSLLAAPGAADLYCAMARRARLRRGRGCGAGRSS